MKKSQNTHIESAYLKANIKTHLLKLKSAKDIVKKVHSNQAMHVKFEVDTLPPLGFESEVKTLFPPITAAIRVLKPSSLFSGKLREPTLGYFSPGFICKIVYETLCLSSLKQKLFLR